MDFRVLPNGYNRGVFHPDFAIVQAVEAIPEHVNK